MATDTMTHTGKIVKAIVDNFENGNIVTNQSISKLTGVTTDIINGFFQKAANKDAIKVAGREGNKNLFVILDKTKFSYDPVIRSGNFSGRAEANQQKEAAKAATAKFFDGTKATTASQDDLIPMFDQLVKKIETLKKDSIDITRFSDAQLVAELQRRMSEKA